MNVHFDSWPGSWSEQKITYSLQPALGDTIAPSVPLTTASKEQQALIHEQQQQIKAQQARIAQLTRQVKTIQAALKENGRSGSAIRTVKAEATTIRQ